MPNWCCNTLKIVALTADAKARLPAIVEGFLSDGNEHSAFQAILPMPQELKDTVAPSPMPNWYDWRVEHWGTKWSEANVEILDRTETLLRVQFETAWAPPLGIYSELCKQGFDVFATYAEGGMGYAGHWLNGVDHEIGFSWLDGDEELCSEEVLARVFSGTGVPEHMLPGGLGG